MLIFRSILAVVAWLLVILIQLSVFMCLSDHSLSNLEFLFILLTGIFFSLIGILQAVRWFQGNWD